MAKVQTSLAQKKCSMEEDESLSTPLEGEALTEILNELGGDWKLIHDHHLEKVFSFEDFNEALAFTNQIGVLAKKEGHYPDIHLSRGVVRVVIWTHKLNGLSENDFILAAKIDLII
ncbi:MAG TPA: 4a-hydroxytetrahydrobiopterin dehydratase [Waddliaceae bacterium]